MSGTSKLSEADLLSTAVIAKLAEHEGVDPLTLDPPLYEAVNLDALDALFHRNGTTTESTITRLAFEYNGCEVQVSADNGVRVIDVDEH